MQIREERLLFFSVDRNIIFREWIAPHAVRLQPIAAVGRVQHNPQSSFTTKNKTHQSTSSRHSSHGTLQILKDGYDHGLSRERCADGDDTKEV